MNNIIQYLDTIIIGLILIACIIMICYKFIGLTKKERYKVIRGWLLQAVALAEKEYGSGTGALKLSVVYDKFCERFPWLAIFVTFETFANLVDEALKELRELLEQKQEIAEVIKGEGME